VTNGPASTSGLTRWFARLRVTLGFVLGPIVWWLAAPNRVSFALGAAIAIVGESLRFWAAGHLNKSREVTASGPYRFVAHPLYVGSALMGLGLAMASANIVAAAIVVVYLAITLSAAIRSEEAFLAKAFGDEYTRYRGSAKVGGTRHFQLARAIGNGEHRALGGLLLVLALLALKTDW
jgi:protein-S-isoprenylcysteine O-methyltransferase Ste14